MSPPLGKKIRTLLRDSLGPSLAAWFIKLYNLTIRAEFMGWERVVAQRKAGPVIFAHWHGDDLSLLVPFSAEDLTIMVSRSRDGDLLSGVLNRLGYDTVRGSSSKGGKEALRQMAGLLERGRSMVLTVDGPRGPRTRVKPGVIALARLSGAPIFPGGVWARKRWVFEKTWHKTYLAKPGTLVRFAFGEPIMVPPDCSLEEGEDLRRRVEEELFRLHEAAEKGPGTGS